MLKVIGIGDNVCDIYNNLNIMYPGGQALNYSAYSKLQGHNSSYIGVFGNDERGKFVYESAKKIGVNLEKSKVVEGENAFAIINLEDGERKFIKSNKGGVLKQNKIVINEQISEYLNDFDIIHTSNNSYIDTELQILKDKVNAYISYDFSTSWSEEKSNSICKYLDFAFISGSKYTETQISDILKNTINNGVKVIVMTRGSEETIVYDGINIIKSKPNKVDVIDTLGAGDTFAASFLNMFISLSSYNWELNKNTEDYKNKIIKSIDYANENAANTCKRLGAFGEGKNIK